MLVTRLSQHVIFVLQNRNGSEQLESWLLNEADACISSIFLNDDQDAFAQLFNLILYENVNGMMFKTALFHFLVFLGSDKKYSKSYLCGR